MSFSRLNSTASHIALGENGEMAARRYLMAKGYDIVCQNWRKGSYEIDLIAKKGKELIIAEVKTRSWTVTEPEQVFSRSKQRNLLKAANIYLGSCEEEVDCRIDLIILEKNEEGFIVTHIEDAIGQA